MYYSQEVIDEVMSRTDIVDVIGGYVSLKKKGSSYMACCPFHGEKTPSFSVSREKGLYHCFGCGESGTAITFVMKLENMSFQEVLKQFAGRAGVALPETPMSEGERAKQNYKETLKEMNRAAAVYFRYVMKHNKNGRRAYEYFRGRGLTDETIDRFALGYAEIYRDDLYKYLRGKGYTDEQLKDSGLVTISEKDGGTDRFWNRAMIPIQDVNGKIVGFGGRVLGDGKPKYINTSDTAAFDKSHTLFALNIAKKNSRQKGFICCEGYMDVISMHQAGFDTAVASLGTAFTFGHANIIKRYADKVWLAYDSDGAGVTATKKVIAILRETGVETRVIDMRPHKDPDEFIQTLGREAFEERIKNAESGLMFLARIYSEEYNQNDPAERAKFQNKVAQEISYIQDVLERKAYIDAVSNKYFIDKAALTARVHDYGVAGLKSPSADEYEESRRERERRPIAGTLASQGGDGRAETDSSSKLMLTWLVDRPELFERLDGVIDESDFEDGIFRSVAQKLFEQYRRTKAVDPAGIVNLSDDADEQNVVAEILQKRMDYEPEEKDMSTAVTEVVRKIKMNSIKRQLAGETDLQKVQKLINDKKKIERLTIKI